MAVTDLDIFTAIWDTASPSFQQRIPEPSRDNWATIGQLISQDNYEPERNEIFDALINLIGIQKVWNRSITNPLARFKTGQMSLGDTYQEIMSDIIDGQTFAIAEHDQFHKWANNVAAAYHKINREQFYPVTIEETKINRAFKTEGGLQSLVNSLVNQMYSSNDLDEFIYTKQLIAGYYNNIEIPLLDTQKLHVPDPRTNLLDTNTMKAFVMCVKGVLKEMSFPNRNYNPMEFMFQTPPSEFVVFLDKDITIASEVNVLSQAFHPQYMDINVPIIPLDEFPGISDAVIGIVAETGWLRIFDTLRRLKTAENARNLYRNYYYHVHQLYAASPFVNVCFLIGDESVGTRNAPDFDIIGALNVSNPEGEKFATEVSNPDGEDFNVDLIE